MEKILILGGWNNASLSIAQSLGHRGYHIDIFTFSCKINKTKFSRYTKRTICRKFDNNVNYLVDLIVKVLENYNYDYVIPTNDMFSLLLARIKESHRGKEHLLVPDYNILVRAMDKQNTMQLASKNGFPVPATYSSVDEVEQFPVVIKSRFSLFIEKNKFKRGSMKVATSREEALSALQHIPYPMLMRKITGTGWGIEVLFVDNRILAAFSHKRLREANPITGSYSSAAISIPLDHNALSRIEKMLGDLKWEGVAMFEFKGDYFLEVNGRFWGSLPLAIQSGVDFPYLYLLAVSQKLHNPYLAYKTGIKSRWLRADIAHLLRTLKTNPLNLKALAEVLNPFQKSYNMVHFDPFPEVVDLFSPFLEKYILKQPCV